jgi:hypothetical protein
MTMKRTTIIYITTLLVALAAAAYAAGTDKIVCDKGYVWDSNKQECVPINKK